MKLKESIKAVMTFIKNLFQKIEKEAKIVIPKGIKVVELLKKFIDSPTADFLTAVIPGEWDDFTKNTLRELLPKIIFELRKWNTVVESDDVDVQLRAVFKEYKELLTKAEQHGLKTEIATQINLALLGKDANPAEVKVLTLTAYHYPEILNNEKAA